MPKAKTTDDSVRVQKFLSEQGVCSRRKAEELIEEGRVKINGQLAELGAKIDPVYDKVTVGNRTIKPRTPKKIVLAMNKPRGVVCSHDDPHNDRTIYDLLPKELLHERLLSAGRLDKESEGLIVLTNDGDIVQQLTHPSEQIVKIYHVTLTRPYQERHTRRLLSGIEDEGDFLRADKVIPAKEGMGADWDKRLEIHLHQGRKREIRRMLERCGYYIKRLKRVQIGKYKLKGIAPGKIKVMSEKDLRALFE